jgi:hypothetical protein
MVSFDSFNDWVVHLSMFEDILSNAGFRRVNQGKRVLSRRDNIDCCTLVDLLSSQQLVELFGKWSVVIFNRNIPIYKFPNIACWVMPWFRGIATLTLPILYHHHSIEAFSIRNWRLHSIELLTLKIIREIFEIGDDVVFYSWFGLPLIKRR